MMTFHGGSTAAERRSCGVDPARLVDDVSGLVAVAIALVVVVVADVPVPIDHSVLCPRGEFLARAPVPPVSGLGVMDPAVQQYLATDPSVKNILLPI